MGCAAQLNQNIAKGRAILSSNCKSSHPDSLKELQRIISTEAAHLDDLGLSATLRWYASRVQEMTGLIIRVDITGEEQALDETVKIAIFRIVQEAFNNIIKHARANSASISMDYKEKSVHILVRDNGIGFDMDAVRNRIWRVSLGLAGMAERAALLGGSVELHSRPDYGTDGSGDPLSWVRKENK